MSKLIGYPDGFEEYVEFIKDLNTKTINGSNNALILMIEELSELQKCATKLLRHPEPSGEDIDNLTEEMADALFTMTTVAHLFGLDQKDLDDTIKKKSKRYRYNGRWGDES